MILAKYREARAKQHGVRPSRRTAFGLAFACWIVGERKLASPFWLAVFRWWSFRAPTWMKISRRELGWPA